MLIKPVFLFSLVAFTNAASFASETATDTSIQTNDEATAAVVQSVQFYKILYVCFISV